MALVLISDRPRRFNVVPDGSGQGLIDHTTPGTTPDPHSMYATDTDLSNHVAEPDPHTGYQLESERNQVNGYAGLDVNACVPPARLYGAGAGTSGILLLTNDLAGSSTAPSIQPGLDRHIADADPHSQYATDADLATHTGAADPHPVYGLKTYNDGRYAMRNKPLCVVRQTVAQSIPNTTFTAINFDTEDEDPLGMHDNTNPNRITVPSGWAGVYFVIGTPMLVANAAGTRIGVLRKNGTDIPASASGIPTSGSTQVGGETSKLVRLAVGDYIDLTVWQNTGGALNTYVASAAQASGLQMFWVST